MLTLLKLAPELHKLRLQLMVVGKEIAISGSRQVPAPGEEIVLLPMMMIRRGKERVVPIPQSSLVRAKAKRRVNAHLHHHRMPREIASWDANRRMPPEMACEVITNLLELVQLLAEKVQVENVIGLHVRFIFGENVQRATSVGNGILIYVNFTLKGDAWLGENVSFCIIRRPSRIQ